MKRAHFCVIAMILPACGGASDRAPEVIGIGSSAPPTPVSLVSVADYVRGPGGSVFVGEAGLPAPADPTRVAAWDGVFVEYERESALVTISDPLGEAVTAEVSVTARSSAPPALVDASGMPATDYVLSGANDPLIERRTLPPSGMSSVFFVLPYEGVIFLVWNAPLVDSQTVSAEGMQSGGTTSVELLRRVLMPPDGGVSL